MIDTAKLSSKYTVRRLNENDAGEVLQLCMGNTQFYEYCEAKPERQQVLNDMRITPPGVDLSDKYYVGFYDDEDLAAVMDLIDGYPDADTAYIGFFMMNMAYQGRQVGTAIITEVLAYLRYAGKTAVRLAIDKGNPQSTHFWKKNGFIVIKEVDRNGWTALVAEKTL